MLRVLPRVQWVPAQRSAPGADVSVEDWPANMAANALAREHARGLRVEAAERTRHVAELAAALRVDVFGVVEAAVLAAARGAHMWSARRSYARRP